MRPGYKRTGVAALLTALAICLPCGAWYIAGSRSVQEREQQLRARPVDHARQEARRIANQLALRLESLRLSETRRPHSDYLNPDEATFEDCACDLHVYSPLAQGPADPLIWAHFQLDEVGQLSLPTLEYNAHEQTDPRYAIQMAIYEELECAGSSRLASILRPPESVEQHVVRGTDGVITVGPFEWFTTKIQQQPALVALREVTTTKAVFAQGFVVLSEALNELIADNAFRASVVPGNTGTGASAALKLDEETWTVEVDTTADLSEAALEAQALSDRFHWIFMLGSVCAMLAGVLVVGLVHKADTLAWQRAQFAASAAHELRTPLAGLQLFGEMLAEGSGDPSRHRLYARRIADEVERLGRVVNNVLGFSHLERNGLSVAPQPGDLAEVLRETVAKLVPALEARGAQLRLTTSEASVAALFDHDAVHQMLQNLVDNAEKYSRDAVNRTIEIGLTVEPAGPVLSVIDHGKGVSAAVRRKLFQPFTHDPDPDAPAGLGLGLALVRALAIKQQATVDHTDVDGGGSCFCITFKAC
jgi:signal transduction histidine kinase